MASNYNYLIPEQDSWASRSDNPADKFIDSLDATSARHLVERAAASDAERAAADTYQQDYRVFLKMYPVYRDTAHNAKLMKHHWEEALGTIIPTLTQIEESFFGLRASGVLHLDAAELAKEDATAVAQRADQIRSARKAAEFNEDAAYSMSMVDLEARARGW